MGIFLRKLWQNKPKQWGSFSRVSSGIVDYYNKNLGIAPPVFYAVVWEGAGLPRNYINNQIPTKAGLPAWDNTTLSYSTANAYFAFEYLFEYDVLGDLTCIARVKPSSFSADMSVVGKTRTNGGLNTAYDFGFFASGDRQKLGRANTGYRVWSGPAQLNVDEWVISGITQGTDISVSPLFYVDGSFVGTGTSEYAGAGTGAATGTTRPLSLGNRNDNLGDFYGHIDYAKIFANQLTDAQMGLEGENQYAPIQPVPQKTIFLPLDAGGGTTITCTTGTVAITGINASVSAGTATTITVTTGSVSITGVNSDISAGKTISVSTGALSISGISANISAGDTISVTTGAVVIQGVNASVSAGATITATTGAISINGINATVTNDGSIIVTTGALVIQGITTSISAGTTITASTGVVVIQSINAIVENIRTITTTTGTLSITGVNVDITSSVVIDVTTGAVIILGFDASIESGGVPVTPLERIYNIPKTNRVNTIKATRRVYTIT